MTGFEVFGSLIADCGTPVVCLVILLYMWSKDRENQEKEKERHQHEIEMLTTSVNNNTESVKNLQSCVDSLKEVVNYIKIKEDLRDE